MLAAVLNRLLGQSAQTAERLAQFAGRTVRIETPVAKANFVLTDTGAFAASAADPEATICLPVDFFMQRSHRSAQALATARYEGDIALASAIAEILASLRFEGEQWLSAKLGDVIAHRLLKTVDRIGNLPASVGGRLLSTYAEYVATEAPLLPKAQEMESWMQEIAMLRADLAQLEQRIQAVETHRH